MKKIMFAALALMTSLAFAGSVTVEGTSYNTIGGNDAKGALIAVSEDINKTFGVYTALSTLQTDNTNSVSSRAEVGASATTTLFGPVSAYTKLGIGQKFSTAGQFTYYSIEPGIKAPIGNTGLTAQLGYRYRTAASNPNVNKDTTDTVRVGLSYAVNKQYTIGARYDRVTGDARQDTASINLTRSF